LRRRGDLCDELVVSPFIPALVAGFIAARMAPSTTS